MKRRFTATQTSTVRDLQRVMTQIKASSLKINQDVMNAHVEVVFDRLGKRYVLRCDAWQDSADNLRAIGLTIQYLYRAIESWGVKIEEARFDAVFDQIFAGLIATPDDSVLMLGDGKAQWYAVLGVKPDADATAIKNAFRALAKIHHPDAGGDKNDFTRLREAYDQGLAQLKTKYQAQFLRLITRMVMLKTPTGNSQFDLFARHIVELLKSHILAERSASEKSGGLCQVVKHQRRKRTHHRIPNHQMQRVSD